MSSNARKMVPAEVLTHPAVVALIDRGTPTGSITPEEVRKATVARLRDLAEDLDPAPAARVGAQR